MEYTGIPLGLDQASFRRQETGLGQRPVCSWHAFGPDPHPEVLMCSFMSTEGYVLINEHVLFFHVLMFDTCS